MSTQSNRPASDHVISESEVAVLSYQMEVISPADDSGTTLVETTLQERFSGGLNGDAIAKHLRVVRHDGTGTFTCVERFVGALDGRPGSFALTAEGFTDEAGVVHGRWEVVPGSGIGELTGLRGFASFYAKQVPESRTGWAARDVLTYWFEAGPAGLT
ncbi:DUF3224 domain-containing protein [Actinoplanes sp. NPDC051513]|uniref:DUF3224 domain-containing protein n=1 Tax=Actinoplanes sp. NPDC051513 TaxID=3363908 RepID=UPI00378F9887